MEEDSKLELTKSDDVEKSIRILNEQITTFLDTLNLPITNLVAKIESRKEIIINLPQIFKNLPIEKCKQSPYLSKFIISAFAGLFDAALNYMWNELINHLRERVSNFDLDFFYDVVIKDADERKKYLTEEDLIGLRDANLIEGCYEIGFFDEATYMRLNHIRDLRNYSSAAHPTEDSIDSYELIGWLQVIIKKVLSIQDTPPVVEIKRLLKFIRSSILSEDQIKLINESIKKMEGEHANSLLKTLYGHYIDPRKEKSVKINIQKIVNITWQKSNDKTKYELGIKCGQYAISDKDRYKLSREFFELVNGLSYLTEDEKIIELNGLINELRDAHENYYNFYNEPPIAKRLIRWIPPSGEIPEKVRQIYVETVVKCRMGNRFGVSRDAVLYYDTMIKLFRDQEIIRFLDYITQTSFIFNYSYSSIQLINLKTIAKTIKLNLVNKTLKDAMDIIINNNTWDEIKSHLNALWPIS